MIHISFPSPTSSMQSATHPETRLTAASTANNPGHPSGWIRSPDHFSLPIRGASEIDYFDPYIDPEYPLVPLRGYTDQKDRSSVKSLDDSAEPMLGDGAPATGVRPGAPRRYNFGILLTALVVSLVAAGAASALLGWLLSRRVYSADNSAFHQALIATESRPKILDMVLGGNPSVGSSGAETTMYGLALSSLLVHLVPFTIPLMLSVFAYLVANMWLRAQTRGHLVALPTPTQYGHLVGLCGAFGFLSLYDTAKYLSSGRKERPAASKSLVAAFVAALVALLINYAPSLSDLWLHTTATTFSYEFPTPPALDLLPVSGSRINTTLCPGPSPFLLNQAEYSNCQHSQTSESGPDMSWGNEGLINEGAAVLGNTSVSSEIQIIGNAATLLPKRLSTGVQDLVFNTFFLLCPRFTPPFAVKTEATSEIYGDAMPMLNQFNVTNNALIFQSGTPDRPAPLVGPYNHSTTAGYALDSMLNPAGVLVVLYWDGAQFSFPQDSTGWYGVGLAPVQYVFHISSCVLDVWDVMMSYSSPMNGTSPTFTPLYKTPSDFNTTSALLGALDSAYSGTLASRLTTTMQASSSANSDTFKSLLAGNLSQGILAFAAPLTERIASVSGQAINSTTLSRYPLAPLCLLLALTYGYAILALAIGIAAFNLSSREIITEGRDVPRRLRELDLLHLRLTNPRVCVADRFDEGETGPMATGKEILKDTPRARRLGAGFAQSGRGEDDPSSSQTTLRSMRKFTVDIVENLEDGRK
ncbi:hypothetical protein B0H17DRAFT_1061327 [Mycena rosella]|uniref:Uncharacterized protein n=1 Tax=Mycena rosella TaxID=1033263 RepID=A0AAD7GJY4_MYCRO|nr:hypothetical protein B0H17DRAFT_1061327 [Mycena rosella]